MLVRIDVIEKLIPGVSTSRNISVIFLAFDFCRFCVVIRVFSSPPQRPMTDFDFEGFSISDFIGYIYFPILILEREPVYPLLNVQC